MKWEMIKDNPVICAMCEDVEIREHYLYCTKENKKVYNAKPKWCPRPLWRNKETGETE